MKKYLHLFSMIAFIGFSLQSCNKSESFVTDIPIEKSQTIEDFHIPFADSAKLKKYSSENKGVVDFELARKIALLELKQTGFVENMGWHGYRISENPVVILDLKSTPRFYDFIAIDAENVPIGTIRLNATKKSSSVINGIFKRIIDYNSILIKSSANSAASIFIDWKGSEFVGVKSNAGNAPIELVSAHTGKFVPNGEVRELEDEEIIEHLSVELIPQLVVNDERAYENIPIALLENNKIVEEIEASRNMTVRNMTDSLRAKLDMTRTEAAAYWNAVSEQQGELMTATDEEINSNSKFSGRSFRLIFSSVDTGLKTIPKYDTKKNQYRRGGWCGPWACGYIVYTNKNIDKYGFFEDCASTYGELGIFNFALRIFGRPLTPFEMAWSMPIASGGSIWISPVLHFMDMYAYDQIGHYGKPALRLCGVGNSLHWTLAYGTKQTGNGLWRTYYFLQIDNGAKVGVPSNMLDGNNYHQVDWWNPWLMVWD